MDPWFWTCIITLVIVAIFAPIAASAEDGGEKVVGHKAWGLLIIPAFFFFMSCFVVVPTKQVAIETSYGKPGPVLTNGWNWKSPQTKVHRYSARLTTEHYSTDKDAEEKPVPVRLFTGSIAKLHLTIQWKLDDGPLFREVFLNYKDPASIRTDLVRRSLQQALNDEFADYNPYAALIAAGSEITPGNVQVSGTFDERGRKALDRLKAELAPQGVLFVSLTIAGIEYDDNTQANLDKLSGKISETQNAKQDVLTAEQKARAIEIMNKAIATPGTLTQLCIQNTIDAIMAGHAFPSGWNCYGPSNVQVVTQ
jgi:regulator of protease activity HflC (stomatin/prohibitin superfamily)